MMNAQELWARYRATAFYSDALDFSLDISRMNLPEGFWANMEPKFQDAFAKMDALEGGAIANPDENRMVGHYWLRSPDKAPGELPAAIKKVLRDIKAFVADVRSGKIAPERAPRFTKLLLIGIGGSALGPQFVHEALSEPTDPMEPFFFDNTDPDGIERTLGRIGEGLKETLTIVISKSGGTKETRNGMLEAQAAYHEMGLHFGHHTVAITGEGSMLDGVAENERWIARFPMFDWVGGRTSELSAVGLIHAALEGFDIDAMLAGAAEMDELTRSKTTGQNPAALLAGAWYHATGGKGQKDMVILPYKDRLELFSRYLQQLVMESLGKEKDLDGNIAHQGIAVYGNKGSTDQHAYVQQLREGVLNFWVTFIEVLQGPRVEGQGELEVESGVTTGDFLSGFLYGTRSALYESGRESTLITVRRVDARTVGRLIALYERAVGFYGTLVNVNAYHQPGVEAGKKAAQTVIDLQGRVLATLDGRAGAAHTADEVAQALGSPDKAEDVYHILRHLAANDRVTCLSKAGPDSTYQNKR